MDFDSVSCVIRITSSYSYCQQMAVEANTPLLNNSIKNTIVKSWKLLLVSQNGK